jgi:hypothetical protein
MENAFIHLPNIVKNFRVKQNMAHRQAESLMSSLLSMGSDKVVDGAGRSLTEFQ